MLHAYKVTGFRKLSHPARIVWGSVEVQTYNWIAFDAAATVHLDVLSCRGALRQGVDMEVDKGFVLADGSRKEAISEPARLVHQGVPRL